MYLFCQKLRLAHPDLDAPQFNFIYDVMAADQALHKQQPTIHTGRPEVDVIKCLHVAVHQSSILTGCHMCSSCNITQCFLLYCQTAGFGVCSFKLPHLFGTNTSVHVSAAYVESMTPCDITKRIKQIKGWVDIYLVWV